MKEKNSPNKFLFNSLNSSSGDFSFKLPESDGGDFMFKDLSGGTGGTGGTGGVSTALQNSATNFIGDPAAKFQFKNLEGVSSGASDSGSGGIGGALGAIGGLAGAATPIGIGLSLAGSVIGAIGARKQERRAARQAKKAKRELKEQESIYKNLDISNPYMNMENVMEDLTIDQKAFNLETQQAQQAQANALDSLRGAAGGSGVAAMAQALAREGSIGAQSRAARIGAQERQNQMAERGEAARIQDLILQGELDKRAAIKERSETFFGMAQQEYAARREQQAQAKQAQMDAITGGLAGAADMFAGFGQGDGTTE
tara:strand:+ start:428 stop:1366 length:939 start_codon:yes stop_codon:yes gene_type:complete